MYFSEHNPHHFHAKYQDYEIKVAIKTGVVEGKFPKRALKAVLEWYEKYQEDLLSNWERCQNDQAPLSIAPLE